MTHPGFIELLACDGDGIWRLRVNIHATKPAVFIMVVVVVIRQHDTGFEELDLAADKSFFRSFKVNRRPPLFYRPVLDIIAFDPSAEILGEFIGIHRSKPLLQTIGLLTILLGNRTLIALKIARWITLVKAANPVNLPLCPCC